MMVTRDLWLILRASFPRLRITRILEFSVKRGRRDITRQCLCQHGMEQNTAESWVGGTATGREPGS